MVLLPLAVERELRIQPHRQHFTGNTKSFFDGGTQILQQPVLHIPDRQDLQQLHRAQLQCVSTGVRVHPYLLSLW